AAPAHGLPPPRAAPRARAEADPQHRRRRSHPLGGARRAMTTARRRIGVVTVSRSDYGHLRSVLDGIRRAPDLELILLVAGMHLAPEFGDTLREIEADGFHIAERIESLDN